MAASSTVDLRGNTSVIGTQALREAHGRRRRRVSGKAWHALKLLRHAIEYLADERIFDGEQFQLADPRVQAALLLMERNREIYLACPEAPTLGERLRGWFGLAES